MRVSQEEFEELVERALEGLPGEFAELLENIAVVVEDEPTDEDLDEVGLDPEDDLLGLYRGVPLIDRGSTYTALPDQVVIFRGPLLRLCETRRELVREVRDTVVHELGHHFGLSDEDMPY
jgi:predicted Zn-dependent protease with MMP-like domain